MTTFVSNDSLTARARYREGVEFAMDQNGQTVGLSDVWASIKRRRWLIFSVVVGCTLLAVAACYVLPTTYTASSVVVLERKDIRPFATDAALTSLERDRSAAETEMDVLQSRQFAGRIVDQLNLIRNPSFNPYATNGPEPKSLNQQLLEYPKKAMGVAPSAKAARIVPDEQEQRDRAISVLLSQIDVSRTGESLAVRITVSNPAPRLAAEITNTMAKLYVESSLEFKQDERIADTQRALNTGGAVAFLRQSTTQPLLITLRNEEARLLQNKAELGAKFGKNHPQMIEADSQLAGVRGMIGDEVQRILSDLEAESLKPSARIVSTAALPTSPSFPKPEIIIPAAFASSTLLGLLLALLLESTDTHVRSGQRTAQLLRVPHLGYVPRIPKQRMKRFHSSPGWNSVTFAEAERAVYMACRYSDAKQAHRTLMITSCRPDTANASTAWGIATAAASDGRTTVFVNLDVHQPNAPASYPGSIPRAERIESYLRKEAPLQEIIQTIPTLPGFGFIDMAPIMIEPFITMDADRLSELVADLKQSGYDLIVLHAPPILATGDASWLSPFVDGVVVIANWGKTTEEELLDAVSQLRLNHANLIGTVINQVNAKIHARHHYGGFVLTAKRAPTPLWKQGRLRGRNGSSTRWEATIDPSPAPTTRSSLDG